MKRSLTICISVVSALLALASCSCGKGAEYDLCVYGGTSSAVVAAYSAALQGMNVALVSPDTRLGGMTSGGLGYTDIGNKQVVSGISRQFYRKVGEHYGALEQWVFEPGVAEEIFEQYASHPKIHLFRGYRLDGVCKDGTRIVSVGASSIGNPEDSLRISADYFIDGTYEGDLMARSGVSYTVGREDNSVYDETYDGVQLMTGHQFPDGIDPYKVKGRPESGLLWGISDAEELPDGLGDDCVQAYNYRICLTDSLENMIPITRPENYDSTRYELLLRLFEAQSGKRRLNHYFIWSAMPNRKTDINNRGGFSTDMIGMNYSYPDAGYAERDSIIKAHKDYTIGLLYFYGHDERVPAELREEMLRWGYPKDEYVQSGSWTPQLYVRESRRMLGEYVATQHDCDGETNVNDGIGLAAYNMDSHNCRRIVVRKNGRAMVKNEGNVEIPGGYPYPISYRSITPKREECTNLLVPVCLSASHIAYGSIRMEPVFMVLGQSAAVAVKVAGRQGVGVQDVDINEVQRILEEDPYLGISHPDIVIDDASELVSFDASWERIRGRTGYGPTYLRSTGDDDAVVEYSLPEGLRGEYTIYAYHQRRKAQKPVLDYSLSVNDKVYHKILNTSELTISGQTSGDWVPLGSYSFPKGSRSSLTLTVEGGQNGKESVADAIMLVRK